MEINNVAVLGVGTMGSGIAQVASTYGHNVCMYDVSDEMISRAKERIKHSLTRFAEKGKIGRDIVDSTLARLRTTTNLKEAVENADLVIEAAPEDIDLKMKILNQVDNHAPSHTILASNTSGLSITMLGDSTSRPGKVIGMHWMNPPQIMRGVEVVKGKHTDDATFRIIVELCKKCNKEPFIAQKDVWLFLAARSERGYAFEPSLMMLRGEVNVLEADSAAKYKLGLPMGCFELADLTGMMEIMIGASKSIDKIVGKYPEWEPRPILTRTLKYLVDNLWQERVSKGLSGVKTGKGFYDYPGPGTYEKPDIPKKPGEKIDPAQIIAPTVNTSVWSLSDRIGTKEDIDRSLKLSFGWPNGIFELADKLGIERIVEALIDKKKRAPQEYKDFYEPDPLLLEMIKKGNLGKNVGRGFYRY